MQRIQLVRHLEQNVAVVLLDSRRRKRGPGGIARGGLDCVPACSASFSSQRETCAKKLRSVSGSPNSASSSRPSAGPSIASACSLVTPLMARFWMNLRLKAKNGAERVVAGLQRFDFAR